MLHIHEYVAYCMTKTLPVVWIDKSSGGIKSLHSINDSRGIKNILKETVT